MTDIYILFFNDYESSDIIGVFTTLEEAENLKKLLIEHPPLDTSIQGYPGSTLAYYASEHYTDYLSRFGIQKYTVGSVVEGLKLTNLQYIELKSMEKES